MTSSPAIISHEPWQSEKAGGGPQRSEARKRGDEHRNWGMILVSVTWLPATSVLRPTVTGKGTASTGQCERLGGCFFKAWRFLRTPPRARAKAVRRAVPIQFPRVRHAGVG
jgi:hypothetical protein